MDLHVIRQRVDGRYCGAVSTGGLAMGCDDARNNEDVCFWGNCTPGGNNPPDWAGNGNPVAPTDPSLDIDDLCGFGPENTNIDAPAAGSYLVAVHFFGNTGCDEAVTDTTNNLRIYLDTEIAGLFTKTMTSGEWWEAAVVHRRGDDSYCLEDLSTPELECPDDAVVFEPDAGPDGGL
jgi:uncharacterized protein YfaP (DUF2135 family)